MPTPRDKTRIGVSLSAPLAERVSADAVRAGMAPGRYLAMLVGSLYSELGESPVVSEESLRAARFGVDASSLVSGD